jgi:four helix bundle protein
MTNLKNQTSSKNQTPNGNKYDLEERSLIFAKDVRLFVPRLPRTIANAEDTKQLVRSSGSVGANYLEANESLGKKDFVMRLRISRKEAKESRYWLTLLDTGNNFQLDTERQRLSNESRELMLILTAIINKAL